MDDDDEQVLDNTLLDAEQFVADLTVGVETVAADSDLTAGVETVVADSVEQPCLM